MKAFDSGKVTFDIPRTFDGDKCPTCGTVFIKDMHPFAVKFRKEQERKRRSRAAKKGWQRRKCEENDPDRDGARHY